MSTENSKAAVILARCAVFGPATAEFRVIGGLIFARTPVEFIAISSMVASFSYFYSTFGMESSVFICLIGLAMLLIKNKIECAWPVLALLVSTRSEGIFLAAPAALLLAYQNRRLPRLPYLLASVIIVATPFIVNQLYYGAMFPHSANAKLGQGRSGLWGKPPAFIHIGYMRNWFFGGSFASIGILLGLSLVGAARNRHDLITWLCVVFIAALASFYVLFNIPAYHWYFAPFFYFFAIFIGLGITTAFHAISDGRRLSFRNGFLIVVLGAFVYAWTHVIDCTKRGGVEHYAAVGRWLEANTPPGSSIGLVEVGTIGWFCTRRIIDILGLVNPHNSGYIADRKFHAWLRHYQPEYVLRHDPPWPHEQSIATLERAALYVPVKDFQVAGVSLLQRSPSATPEEIINFANSFATP